MADETAAILEVMRGVGVCGPVIDRVKDADKSMHEIRIRRELK